VQPYTSKTKAAFSNVPVDLVKNSFNEPAMLERGRAYIIP